MSGKPQVSEAQRRGAEAAELVARAKAGDTAAFDELVRKYRPRVYSLALTLTGQASDADDITQDAFLKAYHKLPEFEGRSEFFTWIYRITLHRALNAKRDRKRMRIVPLDDPRLLAAVAVDSHGNPERAAQLRDRYRALLEAFDQLSSLLQTTVVLTTLQGLSYKEAAVVLETTEGTVAWRIHEARRKMRDYLADLDAGRARTRRRPMSDSAVFRLEKALMQLMPVVPSPAAVG
ncbi:MAG: RNA polymerase subunit sigma [Deltaproteobacteria bacterium]|nr:RNA polymerase sigma factor [Deltaproteobacteria bacterium]MBW2719159.1 RNA polymerase sigma factor [Deltaproteobacteria bacterium]RLB49325.1 MAG: RNA polymerase subunit sigma [Deltaproteobacteria bacterium]